MTSVASRRVMRCMVPVSIPRNARSPSVDSDASAIHQQIAEVLPGCLLLAYESSVGLLGAPIFDSSIPRALEAESLVFQTILGSHACDATGGTDSWIRGHLRLSASGRREGCLELTSGRPCAAVNDILVRALRRTGVPSAEESSLNERCAPSGRDDSGALVSRQAINLGRHCGGFIRAKLRRYCS